MNYRVYVEKKPGFEVESKSMLKNLNTNLELNLTGLRIINTYDLFGFSESLLKKALYKFFGEIVTDHVSLELDLEGCDYIAIEYLPGQFDQRADAAVSCCHLINPKAHIKISSSKIIIIEGASLDDIQKIKHYLINPVESREKDLSILAYNDETKPLPVKEISNFLNYNEDIEIFGEDEAKAFASVENACKVAQSTEMPLLVKQAIELARKNYLAKQATEKAGIYADVPPQMPVKLPKLVKLLTSKVPADFKPAVAMAVFPPLAAHLKGVSFRYTDNQVHEPAMMNLLVAAMSSGKSLVNGPIDCIIDDLVQMDKVNRQKEQDWKDEVSTMGDNKKKPVRPEDICIRIVSPDLTRAAYIQRLDDVQKAGDGFLYCKMDEVDMLKKFNDPSQLIRCCWDCSLDGQERVGVKSVTAQVKTRFNWNASSTIAVTQKFFSVREVADGAVSRLSLATIIRPDFAPRPVVGEYDALFKAQLAPYIHHLNGTSGFKDCKKARLLIERLENEIMETAQLAYNKPYAEFAKRGLANGFRRAMVLYLANGEKWEKSIEDFIEWSVKYDLWCKMRFFGNQMQEAIDADSRMVYHATGVSNLLLYVHDTFDKVEIQRVCQIHGTKTKLAILLCNWKKRGFIVKNEDGTFSKTAKFIGKYGHYGTPGMAA